MAKDYLKLIGARIKQLRREKGDTQEDAGYKAGVNSYYWSRIENGDINVTVETLVKIANALQVDLIDIFVFQEANKDISEKKVKAKLSRIIAKRKPEELQALATIAEIMFRK